MEILAKKCPRCGSKSANSSNPSGRCSACLKKLASNKKKVGHYLHEHKVADDALRRQKGKNGTAHKKSRGLGTRKQIIAKVKSGEKKAGTVLSPDRKDNGKGYASSNVRMIPQHLNRGRHKADPKKLAAWHKKLKKHLDKIDELLAKGAVQNLDQTPPMPSIHSEIGKVHTVEIHPDIDHLYNVKALAKQDPRGKIKVADLKKHKTLSHMANKAPRDANGWITPETIDKHIESLPKKKVQVAIFPYEMQAQQHRGGNSQYVASVRLHPEEKLKMGADAQKAWEHIKKDQHQLDPSHDPFEGVRKDDQIGWSRIDPWKNDKEGKSEPNHGHWHLDEIQSDFQKKNTLAAYKDMLGDSLDADKLHETLSHGHEDPQHAVHSAVNALGRKLGINSVSMDTPEDQAKQSNLTHGDEPESDEDDYIQNNLEDYRKEMHNDMWDEKSPKMLEQSNKNPYFVKALDKIGGKDALKELAGNNRSIFQSEQTGRQFFSKELVEKFKSLSPQEKDALNDFLRPYRLNVHDEAIENLRREHQDSIKDDEKAFHSSELPVHQQLTYEKRPAKLGAELKNKADILGESPGDEAKEVQYMKLNKAIKNLGLSPDDFVTLLQAKASTTDLFKHVDGLDGDDLESLLDYLTESTGISEEDDKDQD